jgi:hypothetical protein
MICDRAINKEKENGKVIPKTAQLEMMCRIYNFPEVIINDVEIWDTDEKAKPARLYAGTPEGIPAELKKRSVEGMYGVPGGISIRLKEKACR